MKTIITVAFVAITLTSCKKFETNNQNTRMQEDMDHSTTMNENGSMMQDSAKMNGNMDHNNMAEKTEDAKTTVTTKQGDINLQGVFSSYLALKNALVSDDANTASTSAGVLKNAVEKLDKSKIPSEKSATFNDAVADMEEHASHIIGKAGDIEHQREHFALLSKDVYQLAKDFGAGQTLYKEFCPMYDDNKGGFWLSERKEIKNPFFGKKMLKCGEVQETLK